MATGAADNMLRVFGQPSPAGAAGAGAWALVASVDHGADVNCVAWNPKQPGLIATAADDWAVRLWRIER